MKPKTPPLPNRKQSGRMIPLLQSMKVGDMAIIKASDKIVTYDAARVLGMKITASGRTCFGKLKAGTLRIWRIS